MTAIQRYILLVLVCAVVMACKDDDKEYAEEPATEVTFTTTVQTRAVANVVTKLEDGDAMNVFMAEETAVESLQQAKTYKAVCRGECGKEHLPSSLVVAPRGIFMPFIPIRRHLQR